MITKAIILSINYNSNECVVEMPAFRNAAGGEMPSINATFSIAPGVYNGYKEGDVVWVAFENGQLQNPCVIGKLYLGAEKENNDPRGSINCSTLKSTLNTIPLTTQLETDKNSIEVAGTTTTYKTIKEIIDALVKLTKANNELAASETIYCTNAHTNIYGYTTAGYSSELISVSGGRSYYQIKFNDRAELTPELAKKYMLYMSGKEILPEYYTDAKYSGVFVTVDQEIYYPAWDNTNNSLKLFVIKK